MSLDAESHAAYRAALAVADEIDPAGRLRVVLHLLRCLGADHVETILTLRLTDLVLGGVFQSPSNGQLSCSSGVNIGRRDAVLLNGRCHELDAEAAQELRTYLRRRTRHVRFRLYRNGKRKNIWHVEAVCAGGHVVRSLRTGERAEAQRELVRMKRDLARRARERDSGWLLPPSYRRGTAISMGQLRLWLNQAIGRQSDSATRAAAACARPLYRSTDRRSRA